MQTHVDGKASRRAAGRRGARVLWGLALALSSALPRGAHAAGDLWTNQGPPAAVITALAADPLAMGRAFAGTAGYGVFKSVDHGMSWMPANAGVEHTYIDAIAVDAVHPDTVFAATPSHGGFMSLDGGGHWHAMNDGLQRLHALHLAVDGAADTLYVATSDGVFRSVAGGAWAPTGLVIRRETASMPDLSFNAWIGCLAVDPMTAVVYACFFTFTDDPGPSWQLLKSMDGRATGDGPD